MKKNTVLYIALVMLAVLALTSIAADGGRTFTVEMTGAAEAPGPGDPDGSGTAVFRLNPGQGEICLTCTSGGGRYGDRISCQPPTETPVCAHG